jgi:hypothetical protein
MPSKLKSKGNSNAETEVTGGLQFHFSPACASVWARRLPTHLSAEPGREAIDEPSASSPSVSVDPFETASRITYSYSWHWRSAFRGRRRTRRTRYDSAYLASGRPRTIAYIHNLVCIRPQCMAFAQAPTEGVRYQHVTMSVTVSAEDCTPSPARVLLATILWHSMWAGFGNLGNSDLGGFGSARG